MIGNTFRGNHLSADSAFGFQFTISVNSQVPTVPVGQLQFRDNLIEDNVVAPQAGGVHSEALAFVLNLAGTSLPIVNQANTFRNNDFGDRPVYIMPGGGFADGGGNKCPPPNASFRSSDYPGQFFVCK